MGVLARCCGAGHSVLVARCVRTAPETLIDKLPAEVYRPGSRT
jgi:hypothetical protein